MKLAKNVLVASLIATMAFPVAHAHKGKKKGQLKRKVQKVCKAVELSQDQKSAIKELKKETGSQVKEIRKNELKPARMEYRAAIKDESATFEMASAASEKIMAARTKIMEIRQSARNQILFEIVPAEKRKQFSKCVRGKRLLRKSKRLRKMKKNYASKTKKKYGKTSKKKEEKKTDKKSDKKA